MEEPKETLEHGQNDQTEIKKDLVQEKGDLKNQRVNSLNQRPRKVTRRTTRRKMLVMH